ncbi:uncharacterized protein ARMOST_04141 [Armillaria ostoyae]|uniref:Uncharacterized protein n=1 Tax=Armillaria ostoyae TaxID=47428 RepID=A0A284QWH6_ARMOS|nr:uncharacterized protein ARMOST_04141 [Armillaria ostoyae]
MGGHLVLWDLKLVIEFPPGSCILLPSALLEHSNLPIQDGEHRSSFVMYSAAGLFRWVENDMMSDAEFLSTAKDEALRAWHGRCAALLLRNLELFPIWEELVQRRAEELHNIQSKP